MLQGKWHDANFDAGLLKERQKAESLCFDFNMSTPGSTEQLFALRKLLGCWSSCCREKIYRAIEFSDLKGVDHMQNKLDQYKKILNSGELYNCYDEELLAYQHVLVEKLNQFNRTPETENGLKKRDVLLREALGTYGEGLYIIPPIYANWGLKNVHVGKNVFFNFNVCLVDDADIYIGDNCQIGPGCHIVTAQHPISPILRKNQLQYNKPVRLGNNVWLGAGAIILPGVTIGDNSIVGAGSVVTHDVEANVVVVGSPAKILRKITEEDNQVYDRGKSIPKEIIEKYIN